MCINRNAAVYSKRLYVAVKRWRNSQLRDATDRGEKSRKREKGNLGRDCVLTRGRFLHLLPLPLLLLSLKNIQRNT